VWTAEEEKEEEGEVLVLLEVLACFAKGEIWTGLWKYTALFVHHSQMPLHSPSITSGLVRESAL
jgi:hypothetical protein